MPFETRTLIDASTGQPFVAQVFIGGGAPPAAPLQGMTVPLAGVPLPAGVDTLIGSIVTAATGDVFVTFAGRASSVFVAGADPLIIRIRLKLDGVQVGGPAAGLDVKYYFDTSVPASSLSWFGSLTGFMTAPDGLPHSYEVWLESDGSVGGTFDEGTLEIEFTP